MQLQDSVMAEPKPLSALLGFLTDMAEIHVYASVCRCIREKFLDDTTWEDVYVDTSKMPSMLMYTLGRRLTTLWKKAAVISLHEHNRKMVAMNTELRWRWQMDKSGVELGITAKYLWYERILVSQKPVSPFVSVQLLVTGETPRFRVGISSSPNTFSIFQTLSRRGGRLFEVSTLSVNVKCDNRVLEEQAVHDVYWDGTPLTQNPPLQLPTECAGAEGQEFGFTLEFIYHGGVLGIGVDGCECCSYAEDVLDDEKFRKADLYYFFMIFEECIRCEKVTVVPVPTRYGEAWPWYPHGDAFQLEPTQ